MSKGYATRRCQNGRSLKVLKDAEQMLLTQSYTRKTNRWVRPVGIW